MKFSPYLAFIIHILVSLSILFMLATIADNIMEIKNTVNQQTHECNYEWFYGKQAHGGLHDTIILYR
jgi:hypothetical protein